MLHKYGDMLYNGVADTVRENLKGASKSVRTASDGLLLEVIVEVWERHKLIMTMIKDILMYMVMLFLFFSK